MHVLPLLGEAQLSRSYPLTKQAQHVLKNLDRVVEKPYVFKVRNPQRRLQLDGIEYTPQITSLVIRGMVREDRNGLLAWTQNGKSLQERLLAVSG